METIAEMIISEYSQKHQRFDENMLDRFLYEFYNSESGKSVKLEDRALVWRVVYGRLSDSFKRV